MSTQVHTRPLAVVTGASSGIGLELARQFAKNGYDLMIAAEDPGIATTARVLMSEYDSDVRPVRVDLATYDGVEELYRNIAETGRPVSALALNAGVGHSGDFVRDTDLRAELNIIDLNVASTVHLAKRVLPDMVERRDGKVLFTSSIAATMPGSFHAVYNASKAFVQSFAEAVRNELKDSGVTVTALMPGATDTDFFRRAGMQNTKVGMGDKDDPAQVAEQGYQALMAGDDHVVAGSVKNRMQVMAGRVLPETMKAEMHRDMAEPGSAQA
jgi:short-subunit dehydrogenase